MYYDYFSIKEFLVDRVMIDVPIHVVDKIEKYHKPIINPIRHKIGQPIQISQNSGYRSKDWELSHGDRDWETSIITLSTRNSLMLK